MTKPILIVGAGLVDPTDALALCTAMIEICDGDRQAMGSASADLYRKEYAPEIVTRVFHEYVEGLPSARSL